MLQYVKVPRQVWPEHKETGQKDQNSICLVSSRADPVRHMPGKMQDILDNITPAIKLWQVRGATTAAAATAQQDWESQDLIKLRVCLW